MQASESRDFWTTDRLDDPRLALPTPRDGQWCAAPAQPLRVRLLDSFDHRLLDAGWMLGIERRFDAAFLVCRHRKGVTRESPWPGSDPVYARDLPASFPDRLAGLLGVRALLPALELEGLRRAWVFEGPMKVPRLRLRVDELDARFGDQTRSLRRRVQVLATGASSHPPHGFMPKARVLWRMERAVMTPYEEAVRLLGGSWSDPRMAPPLPDDPAERSDLAIRRVLAALLHAMRLNEPGVLDAVDTEFLHDYRVAVRRARSILGQMHEALPVGVTSRWRHELADLARVTGQARDADVFLLSLDSRESELPPSWRGQFPLLRETAARLAEKRHGRLKARLSSAAHRRFLASWERYLDRPIPRRPGAARALTPIRVYASQRIWKLYRRLRREGENLDPASPPEHLHEWRKNAKKLRYQLELFQSLFPVAGITPLLRQLRSVQATFGDYQDLGVRADHLRELAEAMRQDAYPTEALLVVGALLDRVLSREPSARTRCHESLAPFTSGRTRRRYRHLFGPSAGNDPPS